MKVSAERHVPQPPPPKMNDRERDRSSDGAGPVAPDEGGPSRRCLRLCLVRTGLLLTLLTSAFAVSAQYAQDATQRGLSVTVGAGVMESSNRTANFYNGSEGNANTVLRILHSQMYGPQIWADLTEQDLITSAVGSYQQLQVVEYGNMFYRMAVQLSLGIRYDYDNGMGWLLHFDYAKLDALGAFNISSNNGTGVLSSAGQFVRCGVAGQEKRIYVDLGLNKQVRLRNGLDLAFQLGGSAVNTTVVANDMQVAGRTYSILDVWDGQSPGAYSQMYEYMNQGGIGLGCFAGVSLGYTLANYDAISVGYTFRYDKINLMGYEQYCPQHLVTLRMDVANFSFLG